MEGDEVVRELDVMISADLDLLLLQFPLKPVYADPLDIKCARLKPKHKKLELDAKYPPEYYYGSGPNLGFDHNAMQNYTSTAIAQGSCLSAGIVHNNIMHITPVKQVYQMRPSFNTMQTKGETYEAMEEDEPSKLEEMEPENDGLQQIQLQRKESERAMSARVHSYTYIQKQESLEPWKNLEVYEIGSEYAPYNLK